MASEKVETKRKKIEESILQSAMPLIENGEYAKLNVRDLCAAIGITTGMFYRHFRTKNDLLSFYAINRQKELYKNALPGMTGKTIKEKLLSISLLSMESNAAIGPESILVHINSENPLCDCTVSRGIFVEQILDIFKSDLPESLYREEWAREIATYLVIIQKGLCFEWYSMRNDPSFDIMVTSEQILNKAIEAMNIPEVE